jgi:hypothetical protein
MRSCKSLLVRVSVLGLLALTVLVVLSPSGSKAAKDETLTKAKFLYTLALYATWPEAKFTSARSDFKFCTIGAEDVASALMWVSTGKKVDGRSVEVVELGSVGSIGSCHVVFFGDADEEKLAGYIDAVSGSGVLSVAGSEKFAEMGGVLGFEMVSGKVQFTINGAAVSREKLKIRDKLMSLGTVI